MWTIEFFKKDEENFNNICSGIKIVEVRALDSIDGEKSFYSNIKVGDIITFICDGNTVQKHVKDIRKYQNLDDLFKIEDIKQIQINTSESKFIDTMLSYPNYKERILKYGLIAIELENV